MIARFDATRYMIEWSGIRALGTEAGGAPLTEAQTLVVRAIVESDRGYVRLDDFPDALSFAVAELMEAGGVVRWCKANGDDAATLTASLAAELGIWLTGQPARWLPKGTFADPRAHGGALRALHRHGLGGQPRRSYAGNAERRGLSTPDGFAAWPGPRVGR